MSVMGSKIGHIASGEAFLVVFFNFFPSNSSIKLLPISYLQIFLRLFDFLELLRIKIKYFLESIIAKNVIRIFLISIILRNLQISVEFLISRMFFSGIFFKQISGIKAKFTQAKIGA